MCSPLADSSFAGREKSYPGKGQYLALSGPNWPHVDLRCSAEVGFFSFSLLSGLLTCSVRSTECLVDFFYFCHHYLTTYASS